MPRKANTPPPTASEEDAYEYGDSSDSGSEYKPDQSDESDESSSDRNRGRRAVLLKGLGVESKVESEDVESRERGRRPERGNLSKRRPRMYKVRSREEKQLYDCEGGEETWSVGAEENDGLDADDVGSSSEGSVGLRVTAGVQESNADERGSLSEGGLTCSPDIISDTALAEAKKRQRRYKRAKQVAPKRVRNRFSCRLGCTGTVQNLRRHYTGHRHKLTESEAGRLALKTTSDKPLKAKGGHYRRICAVPDCGVITSRIADHMRKQHENLATDELEKYKCMASRIQETLHETFTLTPSPVDRGSVSKISAISKIKRLDSVVKSFWKWQISHSGGGRSDDMAQRTSLEVQSYFDRFHPFSLGKLNERNFSIFVEEMRGTKKASSVLFYVRAWLKFLQFLLVRRYISDSRHTHLRTILVNIQNSLQREKKQQDVEADQDAYHGRLPPEVRHAYFQSDYVTKIRRVLMGGLCKDDFVPVRNYLLTALTLWNGHRPGVLRELTFADVNRGEIEVVDDEGPAADRTYVCITVSKHKTVKTWGAAILSLPPLLWRELRKYMALAEVMFDLEEHSPVFLTVSGTGFETSSGLNACLQDSYSRSGTQQAYPQRFNATATRRLITTECRNVDPSSAPLIAAQLCHSVTMADRAYALKRKTQLSSKAVHLAEKSITIRSKEQNNQRRAVDWEEPGPSAKERDLQGDNDLDTETHVSGEDIEEAEPMEEGSGEREIEGWKVQTKWGSQVGENLGLGVGSVTFQDLPEDRGEFGTILGNLLQDLDWHQILQDAQFWTEDLSVYLLGQNTSVLVIADCLHDVLHERFTIDLFQILKTEMPRADDEDNPSLHFVMAALAACRLGVLFGSSVDPDTIPSPGLRLREADLFVQGDLENREDIREERKKLTLVPGELEEIAQEEGQDREIRKDIKRREEQEQERQAERGKIIRERGLGSVVAESAREEGFGGGGSFFKGRRFGDDIDRKLREVYMADLKISVTTGTKLRLATVRRRIDEVHTCFPDLSAQQIRDKLWTIAARERRALERKAKGRGKGKGKRSK